ncbi:MAG: class I adenylate-forming enzyme family protein [Stellaceae bacterium]
MRPMPRFTNAGDLMRRDRDVAKAAIVDLSGSEPRAVSYAGLDAAAAGVARALLTHGLAPGSRIAILGQNSADYLAAFYGIQRAGLVAVPVNHRFPRETIDSILDDCGARLVFADAARSPLVPAALECVVIGDGSGFARFLDPGAFEPPPIPDEPAVFLYTSGSTGTPKGVVLSHAGQIWVAETRMGGADLSRHRYLVAAPLYHMNALALSQLASVAHATIVLLPQFAAPAYIDAIGRFRPTILTAVPPMIAMMLREEAQLARTDLSSVELVRMGSAPVSASLLAATRRGLPQAQVLNAYGTTEAGPVVFGPHPQGLKQPDLSVGYPHPAVSLRLGADGVLEMKSPALMLGYHNRPALRPFTADGYYVTGDVFRRDADGFFFFVGRSDDMFVSGGENIYPGDVERMLERHPAVAQACVVPVPDEIKGTKPIAFIVPQPGRSASAQEIKDFALAHAPAYQHPRFVFFLDRLPLASTNKLDRAALLRLAAERLGEAL